MTKYDEQLARELRSRADDIDGHPISLDAVKSSANRMKWQRRVGTGAVAAAVAVAIPAGAIVISQNTGGGSDLATRPTTNSSGPATDSPTTAATSGPTTGTTPSPTPEVKKVVLTADTERHGGEPHIVTVFDNDIIDIDGTAIPIGEMWTDVLRNGETADSAWMGIAWDNDGNTVLKYASADGSSITDGFPVATGLAVSPPNEQGYGSNVAYYSLDDDTLHLNSSTGNVMETWKFADGTHARPVGILEGGVVYNVEGRQPVAMLATAGGGTQPILGLRSARGVSMSDNLVAGLISVDDFGSCSAVVNASTSEQLWQTCDYTLGAFSPDGEYVIGQPAYLDGIGDGLVAILNAKTGEPVVEYDTQTRQGSFLYGGTVWDADGTLLAMLYDDGWALMRLDVDGVFSNVSTGRIAGAPEDTPLFFGARP
jgi:hypothetical protein